MSSDQHTSCRSSLAGFGRTTVDQVSENLQQALRVLDLVPANKSELTPHPLVVARAEIRNAQRFLLDLVNAEQAQHAPRLTA